MGIAIAFDLVGFKVTGFYFIIISLVSSTYMHVYVLTPISCIFRWKWKFMLITIISCLSKKRLNKIWVIRNNVEAFSCTLDNRHMHIPKYKLQTLIVQIFYQISQRLIIWNQRNLLLFWENTEECTKFHWPSVLWCQKNNMY